MTQEEAIERIKARFYPSHVGLITNETRENAKALRMAIEALQREVPKNPVVNLVSDADGTRRLDEGWTEDALLCPVCHTWFGEVFDEGYCRKCGQKIVQKRVRVVV